MTQINVEKTVSLDFHARNKINVTHVRSIEL
jgi:hypothetical protein